MKRPLSFNNPARIFLGSFLFLILIGTILLMLPVSAASKSLSFIDALFTSTSSVCVTGLSAVDVSSQLSTFGQVVMMVLVQIGGLGLMTFTTFFLFLSGKKPSLMEQVVVEQNLAFSRAITPRRYLRDILLFTFIIESLGTLSFYLSSFTTSSDRLYVSLFHSISAFNNAGFSLFPSNIESFRHSYLLNFTVMVLIVVGGLGFTVHREIWKILRGDLKRLSLHSRTVLSTTAVLIFGGALIFYFSEARNTLEGLSWSEGMVDSLFQSVTARTAGFNSIPIGSIRPFTGLFLILLMFIGASPGSTGGGIKTTTFSLLLLSMKRRLLGRNSVQLFGRNVDSDSTERAQTVFLFSIVVVLLSFSLLLIIEEEKFSFLSLLFETVSALGTVGLSYGITSALEGWSKLILVVVMVIGRVGILNFFSLGLGSKRPPLEYPEERIII